MKPEIDTLLQEKYPEYKDMLEDERDDFWDDLDDKEKYNINKEYLKLIANPNYDYLMCWEPGRFDTDEQATDYDNFYTIDYNWWLYQKESSWNSIGDYKKWMEQGSTTWTPEVVAKSINDFNERYKSYEISLSGDWYRLIDNDVFLYAQLISSKWYIFYQLETYLDDLQEQHIPYTFKDDDFTSLLNEDDPEKIYNANGREKELDAFKDKMRKFINGDLILQIDKILNKYKKVLSGKTFRIDNGYDAESFDPFTDFIFFDTVSLKNVNPQKFLKTFKDHQVDTIELTRIIDELKSMIYLDFERIYNGNYKRFN